ncbi:MAG: non-ribosomal peptide synthetase [Solirubrobacteraceae bacterium]
MSSAAVSLSQEMVERSANGIAVKAPDGTLTYGELSDRADHLARRLRQLGVRPGDLVGQCVARSASLVVTGLAVFRAGAAYVAIDPEYPDERIRWTLEDADVAAVVTDAANAPRVAAFGDRPRVALAAGGELERGGEAQGQPLARAAHPDDVAYVVYTSGSTGRPKGVMVDHAGLDNLVAWHRAEFALDDRDRCTLFASPGFDASVWEIWPAVAAGAALYVVPDELRRDPVGLRDWLVAEGITVTFLPTAVAETVFALPWPESAELRFLLTGGDALTSRPAAGLGFTVVNNYGLSETAVVATSGVVDPEATGPPSIGRAIAGVLAEVVDERLIAVPAGAAGELVVGGVAVSRGYLHADELTAQRFFEDEGGRRYRTGDRVRERPDGELEFLGRVDDQLSIRGFRVEPAEVVAALRAHPAVDSAVAVAAGGSGSDITLVAYAVAVGGERPGHDELTAFLGASLPAYMVPSQYVWLDQLPLTAHGKLDRDALPPAPESGRESPAGRLDGTEVETRIAAVMAELLDVEQVGMEENFFLLGGHSMLGAQLIVRLEDLFGAEIGLRFLFDHPTMAEIAVEVQRQLASGQTTSEAGE